MRETMFIILLFRIPVYIVDRGWDIMYDTPNYSSLRISQLLEYQDIYCSDSSFRHTGDLIVFHSSGK